MSINVEGQDCPVCHSHLFNDDDVVFCPVCGAPYHRDCYASVGHCVYESTHGTSEQYRRPETEDPEGAKIRCPHCGRMSKEDTPFCPYCGAPRQSGSGPDTIPPDGQPGGYRVPGFDYVQIALDPLGGVDPSAKIDGIPVEEIRQFVGMNTQRYIPRFAALSEKHKLSWNWAAFLLPQGWIMFRKCYRVGIFVLLLVFAQSALSLPLSLAVSSIASTLPTDASWGQLTAALTSQQSSVWGYPMILALASMCLSLGVRIFMGLFGDYLYRSHVLRTIRKLQEDETLEDYSAVLAQKGSVSPLLFFIAVLAGNWFSYLLMALAGM